jgi:hypothetical protein
MTAKITKKPSNNSKILSKNTKKIPKIDKTSIEA